MGKAPDAFRTISEVADWLGVQTHVLRFWESKFTQVKPLKRAGGRRYYRPADMELLGGIRKLLHEDGLTIKGAQKFLRENGVKAVADLSPPVDGEEAVASAPAVEAAVEPVAEVAPEVKSAVVDITGEAPAPAAEPEPEGYFDAVDVSGEVPAPAAEVHILRDGPEAAVDMTGEAPAPAVEVETAEDAVEAVENLFADDSEPDEPESAAGESAPPAEEDEALGLPSFIRKPMSGRETTVPPVTPGPLPLTGAEMVDEADAEAEPEPEDHRFAGVGAAEMPDRAPAPQEEEASEPVAFVPPAPPAPQAPAPDESAAEATPQEALDGDQLRPLYDRLRALRARMG
ncbi:MerR family transcriptional regulator [Oceanicola sp. 502str15]|uniref:MerR family transcriptional regulator n=1 Tax=Oceanicola sp. 502str15 TaxID=2696061 RepID=UPI002095C016|nr:MerR family transcriptional regulator [Oceanicola sp. 502str15]MCO6382172.1 MerR family transcriptional regulator [Oceanicola sp. 502str15]